MPGSMAELMAVYHPSLWKHPPLSHGAMAPAASSLQVHHYALQRLIPVVGCQLEPLCVDCSRFSYLRRPSTVHRRRKVLHRGNQHPKYRSRIASSESRLFVGARNGSGGSPASVECSAISSAISSSATTTATRPPNLHDHCAELVGVARFQAARPQASLIHQRSHLTASLFCGSQRVTGTCSSMDQL